MGEGTRGRRGGGGKRTELQLNCGKPRKNGGTGECLHDERGS